LHYFERFILREIEKAVIEAGLLTRAQNLKKKTATESAFLNCFTPFTKTHKSLPIKSTESTKKERGHLNY
jgi:hypothetical protein